MESQRSATPMGAPVLAATKTAACPLCGKAIVPDRYGRQTCPCGWGGPGDPAESSRGLSRAITRLDRRIANRLALRDLDRVASGRIFDSLGIFYRAALLITGTFIYLVIFALLAGSVWLAAHYAQDGTWLGVALGLFFTGLILYALSLGSTHAKGIFATRDRFPALFAALDEVSARTGGKLPHRVLLDPDGNFFVYQHHPLRRLFMTERVLAVGVAALPLMTEEEAKAVLAHELAHYRNLDTTFHRYYDSADRALHYILRIVRESLTESDNRFKTRSRYVRSYSMGDPGGLVTLILIPVFFVALLPLRLLWFGFHLLRLGESRRAEFAADRLAIQSYGAEAVIGGLSGVTSAMRSVRQTGDSLVSDMRRNNSRNYYAALRSYYAELPPEYRERIRRESSQGYPSLEDSHPTRSDRLIAARLQDPGGTALVETPRPASQLIVPLGATSADDIEISLSETLLARHYARRRR